ncbi:MAG: hypothetical protein WCJ56_07070 [bacterium]
MKIRNTGTYTIDEIEKHVWECIRKTIDEFRRRPYQFLREAAIVNYMRKCLFTTQLEVEYKDRRLYLVDKNYPTNFRYDKDLLMTMKEPYPLSDDQGTQGYYDLVVIKPEYVEKPSLADIANNKVPKIETWFNSNSKELLFAIEFNFVTCDDSTFVEDIKIDNKKLLFAKGSNVGHAINLVFCVVNKENSSKYKEAAFAAEPGVTAIFIQSYLDTHKKIMVKPKPLLHTNDQAVKLLHGYKLCE